MARIGEFLELYERPDNPYPDKFHPTFHRYRLPEPRRIKKSSTIFVCSMADLFGDWVPDTWIKEVFKACDAAPQHQYLFLTKNPGRYQRMILTGQLPYKENYWFGRTVVGGEVQSENNFHTDFISIEPLLFPVKYLAYAKTKWVIVGAESGNSKKKVEPKREWVEDIAYQCNAAGIPLFMKNSLRSQMGDEFVQEWPWPVPENKFDEDKRSQSCMGGRTGYQQVG